jgi:hypothetical protein
VTSIISRCIICDQFFDSRRQLKKHKDENHRITNSKMMILLKTTKHAVKKEMQIPKDRFKVEAFTGY